MNACVAGEATLVGPCRSPTGRDGVGVVVKRVLAFRTTEQVPTEVRKEPLYEGDTLLADADSLAAHKPCTDIVVSGSAFTASPVSSMLVSVAVGTAKKCIRVHGQRRIYSRAGSVRIEQEAPFKGERLLCYAEAYGGFLGEPPRPRRGAFGARENADLDPSYHIYPRNPVGRGFVTRALAETLDGSLAPSQELVDDPVTADRLVRRTELDWPTAPLAGGFGPIGMGWFPRVQWLVPFTKAALGDHLLETTLGAMTLEDRERTIGVPDPRVLACAAPGLAVPFLNGRVPVRLDGFRWGNGQKHLVVDVSSPMARLAFPNAGFYDVALELKTFAIDADKEEISLVWAGFQPTAMKYRDEDVMDVGLEVRNP